MEPNKNKNMWMWIGVVAVVLIGIVLLNMNKKSDDVSMEGDDTEVVTDADTKTPVENTKVENTTKPTPAVSLTYQQALDQYKDKRIQFNDACGAFPNTVTYKDNTGIMLDNRSSKTRTIKVGTTYTVKAYGFKIITLPDISKAPSTILVDCDNMQNVATILVQE